MKYGEDAILACIGKYFPNTHETFCMGRGDDCALIQVPHNLLAITSDVFAQNAHFRTRYFSPFDIGYKSLAVNISDLASNGALPRSFSLNLTLTDKEDMAWIEEFLKGMSSLANKYNIGLLGGDLAKVPTVTSAQDCCNFEKNAETQSALNIGITAFGDYSHGGLPLLRNHAFLCQHNIYPSHHQDRNRVASMEDKKKSLENGDILFIVGEIGLARTGLFLLEKTNTPEEIEGVREQFPHAYKAHLQPKPLVQEGLFLSQFAHKHTIFCMDISDGLKRDIPRLLGQEGIFSFQRSDTHNIVQKQKRYSADITIENAYIHEEVKKYCEENKKDPVSFAYSGGEDYGLLGACSQEAWEELSQEWTNRQGLHTLCKIGEVRIVEGTNQDAQIMLNGECVTGAGFDHFTPY